MKRIKMVVYGEPGVGKSVFASKAPKPFFITTDGNYEWLEDFGAKPEDHLQVNSWSEAKKAFTMDFSKYETIVIDLTEDLFKWCEQEYCQRNKFEHISDIGYGKGYDITRNEFFIELCKLIGLDKHIIFIMHGITFTVKDRRGVEHTKYGPTNRIPDKVLDMIEGRVRYFLRAYLKAEEQPDGTIKKKRFLSLVPKENEFGIARGIDEATMPHDIPLDFDEFANAIGLYSHISNNADVQPQAQSQVQVQTQDSDNKVDEPNNVEEATEEPQFQEEPRRRRRRTKAEIQAAREAEAQNSEAQEINENTDSVPDTQMTIEEVQSEVIQESQPETQTAPKTELSREDKIAAIKAKLAALKEQGV